MLGVVLIVVSLVLVLIFTLVFGFGCCFGSVLLLMCAWWQNHISELVCLLLKFCAASSHSNGNQG